MNYESIEDWRELVLSVCPQDAIKFVPAGSSSSAIRDANTLCWETLKSPERSGGVDPDLIWYAGNCLKKFRCGSSSVDPFARASESVDGFLARNEEVAYRSLRWDVRLRARDLLARALPYPDICDPGRFGTGSVREGVPVATRWTRVAGNPSLRQGPLVRASVLGSIARDGWARLCCVPKDLWIDRVITVEPMIQAYQQQAARFMLEASIHQGPLRGSVMDAYAWRDPVVQQQTRALAASKLPSLMTVDLKDASDNVSWSNVQGVFPAWVCAACEPWRSTSVRWRGAEHTLNMYAGMGNATTFRIETLYFWAIATAVADILHVGGRVTVFGDDIVGPSALFTHPLGLALMGEAGLVVNTLKSGSPGYLAEACGAMFIAGRRLGTLNRIYGCTDVISLADLCQRLLDSLSWIQRRIGWELWYVSDLRSIQTDLRPVRTCDIVASVDILDRGAALEAGPAWTIGCKATCRKPSRRFSYRHDLTPGQAYGVLRGQLKADTVRDGRHRGKTALSSPVRDDDATLAEAFVAFA